MYNMSEDTRTQVLARSITHNVVNSIIINILHHYTYYKNRHVFKKSA